MCGIVGYSVKNKYSINFKQAINQLKHRGPDGQGSVFFRDQKVGLGHTRLAIQDLTEAGAQPMLSECKKIAISFNGEIYNFPELRDQLKRSGYKFQTRTVQYIDVV